MKSSHTLKHLILLLLVPIIGIFLLIFINTTVNRQLIALDEKTNNLQAKIDIGAYIVNTLHKVRSDFYELASTTSNHFGRKLVQTRIKKQLEQINKAVTILEKGGSLKTTLRLNLVGHAQTIKLITYKKTNTSHISMEAIDVRPKLIEFEQMNSKLIELLNSLDFAKKNNNQTLFFKLSSDIKRFYKTTPSFFNRMIENSSRLLYEGQLQLETLQKSTHEEKQFYVRLELVLIFIIILLILIIGYILAKQIMKNNKDLHYFNKQLNIKIKQLQSQEAYTRGILDAQPNIIVVSNGEEMLDANVALVEFFHNYTSFDEFKDEHACICDYFEDMGTDEYIIDKEYEEGMWFEHILFHSKKIHKVAMHSGESLHYFTIQAMKKNIDKNNFIIIIALNDITNELLSNQELQKLNNSLESIVEIKTKKLQYLNNNLEDKIKEELKKNREKDQKLIQQSRYAALGEMIANIAHQWRQPLSAIYSTCTGMNLQLELKLAKEQDMQDSLKNITKYVDYLNQTIEDFRAFFKKDKDIVRFDINTILQKSINITSSAYKDNNITITFESSKKIEAIGFPNELAQAFINIFNNAKDALIENQIYDKQVLIQCHVQKEYSCIEIYDNAGGIPQEILTKIFDPYFTTKHQSQGTGIGLYMSKEIIEKNLKGLLEVENKSFKIGPKSYYGACFTIHIPTINM